MSEKDADTLTAWLWVVVVLLAVAAFPITLTVVAVWLVWTKTEWKQNNKIIVSIASAAVGLVVMSALVSSFSGNSNQPSPEPPVSSSAQSAPPPVSKPASEPAPEKIVWHRIVKKEDLTIKAIAGNLSDNGVDQIDAAPLDERWQYRVLVKRGVTKRQLKALAQKLVSDLPQRVDEASFLFYYEKTDTNGAFSAGKAEWGPGGEWGNVTPEIAASDVRSGYEIKLEVQEANLGKPAKPPVKRFGLTEAQRRAVFWKLAEAEDRAYAEAYDAVPASQVEKVADMMNKLTEKYKARIKRRYHLNDRAIVKITVEGMDNQWPTPEPEN